MRLMPRFLQYAAPLAVLPGQAVAEGMPQLDFKNPLVQGQVIWGALIFLGFYLILSRSALPRIANVLRQRQDCIQGDLDLARRTGEKAEEAQKESIMARKAASEQARATIQAIRDAAKADAQAQAAATAKRLEAEIRQAEENIATMRANILSHLGEIAEQTTKTLTERLIGHQDADAVAQAVQRLKK